MKSLERREILPCVAQELVAHALSFANKNGWEICAAVVDPHGYLVAFGRADNVAPQISEFAMDKAFTAGTLRSATEVFGKRMAASQTLSLGVSTRKRLLPWGGGLPIFEKKICIGGIGVSGAQEFEDIDCATAAVLAAGLRLE